ncbi:MAG: HAMP domain-containing histidine kinase [Firmicutes bacterium]|nr:HAMP domain-containing histidine kinase [Bacillota bacterium]
MIKKLKLKLTLITMSLVTLLLVLAFAALLIFSWKNSQTQIDQALQMALSDFTGEFSDDFSQNFPKNSSQEAFSDKTPPPLPDNETANETAENDTQAFIRMGQRDGFRRDQFDESRFTPTITVRVMTDGSVSIIRSNLASISEDDLNQIVSEASSSGKTGGILSDYQLKFQFAAQESSDSEEGTVVAFADLSRANSQLSSLALNALAIGLPALVVLFFISLGLSSLAVKPVEKSLQQQKQFVADASHELKTPLTVIMTNNEILLRHPNSTVKEENKWLESTRQEGLRMRELIENLLFLAKSDADRLPQTLSQIDLSDLAEETVLTFEPVAFEQGILVESEIQENIQIWADQAQLKQLMMILLDNAVKYSAPGKTVTLRLFKEASWVRLSVHNFGDPILPEQIPHLFERFYRTDSARTHSEKGGYGLGLSIAQTITALHHGNISCTSSEKEGTIFLAELPLKQNPKNSAKEKQKASER